MLHDLCSCCGLTRRSVMATHERLLWLAVTDLAALHVRMQVDGGSGGSGLRAEGGLRVPHPLQPSPRKICGEAQDRDVHAACLPSPSTAPRVGDPLPKPLPAALLHCLPHPLHPTKQPCSTIAAPMPSMHACASQNLGMQADRAGSGGAGVGGKSGQVSRSHSLSYTPSPKDSRELDVVGQLGLGQSSQTKGGRASWAGAQPPATSALTSSSSGASLAATKGDASVAAHGAAAAAGVTAGQAAAAAAAAGHESAVPRLRSFAVHVSSTGEEGQAAAAAAAGAGAGAFAAEAGAGPGAGGGRNSPRASATPKAVGVAAGAAGAAAGPEAGAHSAHAHGTKAASRPPMLGSTPVHTCVRFSYLSSERMW